MKGCRFIEEYEILAISVQWCTWYRTVHCAKSTFTHRLFTACFPSVVLIYFNSKNTAISYNKEQTSVELYLELVKQRALTLSLPLLRSKTLHTSRKSRCNLTFCSCAFISSFWDELKFSSNSLILFVNSWNRRTNFKVITLLI